MELEEDPTELVESHRKENVKPRLSEAMEENFRRPKVTWSLPDSDSADTDTDDVPSANPIQTVSTVDDNEKDYFWDESGPSLPVPIPGGLYRGRSLENIKKASLEYLNDIIEEYTIGFDLTTFPQAIANWIPRLRDALPGSYEHLLLLIFDEVKEFNKFQSALRDSGVPDSLKPRQDGTLTINTDRSGRKPIGRGRYKGQSKSILIPRGRIVQYSQTTDEMSFSRELHILRLMVAPLRDEKEEIIWITSREEQPDDMIQQFEAAKLVINDFKKHIVNALLKGPENSE
jgi:hypothetical protein